MVFTRRRKSSPFANFIVGFIFLIIGVVIGTMFYKEYYLICNATEKLKGICVIQEKGLFGESFNEFPSNQITDIRTEEHTSRSKSGRINYSYSIHMKLAEGKEIQFPPNTSVAADLRDQMLNKLNQLRASSGTMPVYLNHDTRMFSIIGLGFFCLIGIILIFTSFFR